MFVCFGFKSSVVNLIYSRQLQFYYKIKVFNLKLGCFCYQCNCRAYKCRTTSRAE
jgi:hypothetical protein